MTRLAFTTKPARPRQGYRSLVSALVLTAFLPLVAASGKMISQHPPAPDTLASLPFVLNFNHPYVQVRVNGSEPLNFIVDTGAQVLVVDAEAARRVGLAAEPIDQAAAGGGEGTVSLSLAHDVSLTVGGVVDTFASVYVVPMDTVLSPHEGMHVHGLLGHDFFQRYVLRMDHEAQRLDLFDPQQYRYDGDGFVVPIRVVNNHPHVGGTIVPPGRTPLEADLVVDTGAAGTVYLATQYVDTHGFLDAGMPARPGFVGGVGGLTTQPVGRIDAIRFGPVTHTHVPTYFSQDQRGGFAGQLGADGIIGTEILRRYTAIWDYPHERLILEPNGRVDEPYDHDVTGLSGLYVTASGPQLRTVTVAQVVAGTPAAEAGIRAGDVIVSIDEQDTRTLSLEAIRKLFLVARTYRLRIRRGSDQIETQITLRTSI